jgi:hypothetical protein
MLACAALGAAFVAGRTSAPPAAEAQVMGLSHFRCYTANFTGTTAVPVPVALKDQFGVTNAMVTRPYFFCTPVAKKLLKSEPQQFPQPADHLTCYLAEGKGLGIVRTGANQLGKVQVRDLVPRLLCVPTHKFEPKPGSAG